MSEVMPNGWVVAPLGDLIGSSGLISDGDWVESKDQDPNGAVRLIQLADVGDGVFRNKSERFMSPEQASELSCTYLKPGDVLVARMPDPLGRACLFPGLDQDAVTVVDVCVIRPGEGAPISNRLLIYWINSPVFRATVAENASGTTRKRITRKKLQKFELPLPPLAEQKVIADKLDTLLVQVENTKARLERIPQILKRFRQSVLAAAVSGRLTEVWRGTPSAPFQQPPITIGRENEQAPAGWIWLNLVDLAKLESGHTPRKSRLDYWRDGDIPWISLQDIRKAHGRIISRTKSMPNIKGIENSSARILPEGTVCFSRDISVGYTTIMGRDMATTQHFVNWVCGPKLNNHYLMYAFMAAKDHVTNSGQGTTVKTIYMPACKQFRIITPPLDEQTEIVRRVDQLFAHADRIEQQVNKALTRVNNLTQSILAKAFRGELTEQWRKDNTDLISGENSAEALLERIKVEREATATRKSPRKRKTA